MNLAVTNHSPTINQTGVFLNETINIYFNKAIDPTTIKWDVFSINDNYSFATVVGTLGPIWASGINLSGITSGMAFIPSTNFLPNTEYNVYVYGKPSSVLAKDGTEMQETYTYNFITGTGYYDSVGEIGVPISGSESTSSSTVDLNEIGPYVESIIRDFSVYTTSPINHSSNQPLETSEINIIFTGNILTNASDISGYISISEQPVLY